MLTQITFVKVLIITQIFIKVKEKLEVSEAYITLAPSHVPPGQRGKDEGGKRASQSGGRKGRKSQCGGRVARRCRRVRPSVVRNNEEEWLGNARIAKWRGNRATKNVLDDSRSQMSFGKNIHDSSRRSRHLAPSTCAILQRTFCGALASGQCRVRMTKLSQERSFQYWPEIFEGRSVFGTWLVNQSYITDN